MEDGVSVPYALFNLEDRGRFFIGAGEQVYTGMILGEHNRDNDLEVNPLKGKKLTNVRASGKDEAVVLTTAGPPDARAGDRLRRGRRAGRGDPAAHPAAQAPPRPARAQAPGAAERRPEPAVDDMRIRILRSGFAIHGRVVSCNCKARLRSPSDCRLMPVNRSGLPLIECATASQPWVRAVGMVCAW